MQAEGSAPGFNRTPALAGRMREIAFQLPGHPMQRILPDELAAYPPAGVPISAGVCRNRRGIPLLLSSQLVANPIREPRNPETNAHRTERALRGHPIAPEIPETQHVPLLPHLTLE